MESNDILNKEAGQPRRERRRMKKGWNVALISIGSLLGIVVVVVVVALWLVLTPARLTSMVNKLSDKYILCESQFDNVDLTVLKTFPYVGLKVQGVSIVNPMAGAPSDTVAHIDELCVGINLREYLKNKNVEVTKLVLDNTTANLYCNNIGQANYDIFPTSDTPDTTPSEPFKMPDMVSLESIRIKNLNATYCDEQSGMSALLGDANVSVDGKYETASLDAKVSVDVDRLDFAMQGDSSMVDACLQQLSLSLKGDSKSSRLDGDVALYVKQGALTLNGQQYVNDAVQARKGNLLQVESHVTGDLKNGQLTVDGLEAMLKDYLLSLNGDVTLPTGNQPLSVDVQFATNSWGVKDLLAMLPAQFTSWQKGMSLDAVAELTGTAKGRLTDTELPEIAANLKLQNGCFYDRSLLPYSLTGITADISAGLDLNEGGVSTVDVTKLTANTGRNHLEVSGHIDDLLGKMQTDAAVRGTVYLSDVQQMMPDDLNLVMDGKASLNLKANTNLEQLQNADFEHMKLFGDIGLTNISVDYDTICAQIPKANVNVQLPAKMNRGLFGELLSATITASGISAQMPNSSIDGTIGETKLQAAISNIFDSTLPFRLVCDFDFASIEGKLDTITAAIAGPAGSFAMIPAGGNSEKVKYSIDFTSSAMRCSVSDSMSLDLAGLSIKGGANYDPDKPNTLQQWSPNLDIDFKRGYVNVAQLPYVVQIPDIKFNYKPERCEISSANVVFGNSDFYLSGAVTGLEKWLSHEEMLKGDLYFTSNYTNVDDLLDVFSGMGTDADTLEAQRKEDNVDTSAHPFIVPRDVDFTLHTRIKEATAFENDLREVAGDVQVRDGLAVLNQVGFVCKAARMQLTGMYKTPRFNHIFVGMDFHLLDINIQELIEMIPYVDTLVPILADLEGAADFHLCAETYVNAFYKPKMSTLRAAGALTGQNLVVLDNKDIDRIAKLLQLKSWREDDSKIHIDSLDVAMTVFRRELEVYPFLLSLHKYQIVAEGRHNLDNNYDYHVELVQTPLPVRLAVDVFGTMPNLKFDISPKLRYKNLYRPAKRSEVDNEVLRLKKMIRESLEANVKEETREYEGFEKEEEQ